MAQSASASKGYFYALLIALLLAVRIFTPAGFMPTFERGRMIVVLCPEAATASAPMSHHRAPGHDKDHHHSCPYAAASSLGGVSDAAFWAHPPLPVGTTEPVGQAFEFVQRLRAHDRPPLRGPPLPA